VSSLSLKFALVAAPVAVGQANNLTLRHKGSLRLTY